MSLSSALYTGLSGLDVAQAWMQVVGNNIANVNTTAFKSSRALFKPDFYVTNADGSSPNDSQGGTNPSQSGLGATVASIQKKLTQGSITPTGASTDMAIDGSGYFIVQDQTRGQQFTRDGSFTLNANHQLVTSAGGFVQGYGVDTSGAIIPGSLQNLTIPLGADTVAQATSNVQLVGNLAADGALSSGGSIINSQDLTITGGGGTPTGTTVLSQLVSSGSATPAFTVGQSLSLNATQNGSKITPQTFTVTSSSTINDLQTFFNNALGIDTSVTGTGAQLVAGTAPNSVDFQIDGNSGAPNALSINSAGFTDASGNTPFNFTANPAGVAAGEGSSTSMTVYDSLGVPVNMTVTTVLQSSGNTGTTWKYYVRSPDNLDPANPGQTLVGTGTLSFDSGGALTASTGADISIFRAGTGASPTLPLHLDFSGMSSLAQDASHKGSSMEMSSQDGVQLGTLVSYAIGADGTVTGSFDNGQTRALAQVAVATFNNPEGLNDDGGNMFSSGANSGVPIVTAPQTLGAGSIRAGALEQSNVDLSAEFINLISASTGFSAASKVITTSNQMLTDLLNSQR